MIDRELIELAAKAAGIRGRFGQVLPDGKVIYESTYFADSLSALWACDEETIVWDPMNEDGDALRLAVKLRLVLTVRPNDVRCHKWADHGKRREFLTESGDHYAATRRAIVRAAAEIGKE